MIFLCLDLSWYGLLYSFWIFIYSCRTISSAFALRFESIQYQHLYKSEIAVSFDGDLNYVDHGLRVRLHYSFTCHLEIYTLYVVNMMYLQVDFMNTVVIFELIRLWSEPSWAANLILWTINQIVFPPVVWKYICIPVDEIH